MEKGTGFSLIELLVTLAVLAIGLALAIPSFSELVKNNKVTNTSNNLVRALQLARSEAAKRNTRVAICRSRDQAQCKTGTGWADGWIVFVEDRRAAGNTFGVVDASETAHIISREGALPGTLRVTVFADVIWFNSSGRPVDKNGNPISGEIKVCDDRQGAYGNFIKLNATGRVRLETEASCP
jgi:type IV fimbrial biogenesis protein FimT